MSSTIKILLIIVLLLILGLMQNYTIIKQAEQMINTSNAIPTHRPFDEDNLSTGPVDMMNPINNDTLIRQYDYNKIYNVLEEPRRRTPSYELPPFYVKRLIDYPTRGYPDNYTQYGILRRIDHHKPKGEESHNDVYQSNNFIIRLFGRQQYPGSNRYEYYTMINNGLDQIKIPIYNRRQELYDEDIIYIKELGSKYQVSLYDYEEPKYYPDLL